MPNHYSNCTILRTWEQTTYNLNMLTGDKSDEIKETVTGECNTPLFSQLERATGICNACASGWEVVENQFASQNEKMRANISRRVN